MIDYFDTQGNKRYRINVSLGGEGLLMEDIDMFSYTNEMNKLYITGYIEYTDKHAVVDRYLEKQVVELKIEFGRLELKQDGNSSDIADWEQKETVSINFYVDNAEILENQDSVVKYKLYLISQNWINLNKNVTISTHTAGNSNDECTTSPTELIKTSLAVGDFTTDTSSFENNASTSLTDYISKSSDTVFTSVRYLLAKTAINCFNLDKSMKTLVIDDSTNIVYLFDMSPKGQRLGTFNCPIVINVLRSGDDINYQESVHMGYVAKRRKIVAQMDTKTRNYTAYKLKTNSFSTTAMDSLKIQNFANGGNGIKFSYDVPETIQDNQMEWYDDMTLYSNMFEAITKSNGLIVNQHGEIGTIPGYRCSVTVPTNMLKSLNEDDVFMEEEMEKYQSITKDWDICKVQTFISPKRSIFKQKLVLFRV